MSTISFTKSFTSKLVIIFHPLGGVVPENASGGGSRESSKRPGCVALRENAPVGLLPRHRGSLRRQLEPGEEPGNNSDRVERFHVEN